MALPWRRKPPNPAIVYNHEDSGSSPVPLLPFQYDESRIMRITEQAGEVKVRLTQDNDDLYVHLSDKSDKKEIKLTFDEWQHLERIILKGVLEMTVLR